MFPLAKIFVVSIDYATVIIAILTQSVFQYEVRAWHVVSFRQWIPNLLCKTGSLPVKLWWNRNALRQNVELIYRPTVVNLAPDKQPVPCGKMSEPKFFRDFFQLLYPVCVAKAPCHLFWTHGPFVFASLGLCGGLTKSTRLATKSIKHLQRYFQDDSCIIDQTEQSRQ